MGRIRVALCARMVFPDDHCNGNTFESAVGIIQSLPKEGPMQISRDQKLRFYSLFKQATIGPCNVPRPSFWNVIDVFKWDAWNSLGSMPSDEAKQKYVETFREFVADVMDKYNFVPWLKANDEFCETVLRPKFYALGYDWKLIEEEDGGRLVNATNEINDQSAESADTPQDTEIETEANTEEDVTSKRKRDSSIVCCSDDDYTDAKDENEHFHLLPAAEVGGKKSASGSRRSSNSGSVAANSTEKIQGRALRNTDMYISTLAARLTTLLRMLSSQQKILTSVLNRISPQMDGIFLNFRTLIFLLVWPIVVNLIMRYFSFWIKS